MRSHGEQNATSGVPSRNGNRDEYDEKRVYLMFGVSAGSLVVTSVTSELGSFSLFGILLSSRTHTALKRTDMDKVGISEELNQHQYAATSLDTSPP